MCPVLSHTEKIPDTAEVQPASEAILSTPITTEHAQALKNAKYLLENPGLAARFSNSIASPLEKGMALLPENARETILKVTSNALETALNTALYSLGKDQQPAWNLLHKASAAVSGAAGGVFGLPALAIELPVSTTIMLRSIADIARSEGEDISSQEVRFACLEVFALGGPGSSDDATETGYFGIRTALAGLISDAAQFAASAGAVKESAPILMRLITQIAARFSIPVTEKAAAQAIPIIGAAGGAIINTLFIDHFQGIARGHFVVRRLERIYGKELVKLTYTSLS